MQNENGTVLEVGYEKEHVRLLELPPELLPLLTSEEPPLLQLKSSTSDTSSPDTSSRDTPSSHNAVLCTSKSTFQIRQVQSSNSIFILKPSISSSHTGNQHQTESVVNAFAQCATTLELVPSDEPSISYLTRALPVHNESGIVHADGRRSDVIRAKDEYFADLAFSTGELDTAWVDICAFEYEGQAWRPSETVLLALWGSILTNATVNGLDLGKRVLVEELVAFALEDGHKEELLHATLRRLRNDVEDPKHAWTTIDREKCVSWVGNLLLQSHAANGGISESFLLSQWRNQLPEPWRQYADLGLLKGGFSVSGSGNLLAQASHIGNDRVSTPKSTTGKKLGKWHEKFISTRK